MLIDWAGRVEPTGVFLARSSDELIGLLQAALDSVPDTFVVVLSPTRHILVARGDLFSARGLWSPGLEGQRLQDLDRGAEFAALLDPLVDDALRGTTRETIVSSDDGLALDVRVGPVRDAEGVVQAAVVVAHDVSERRAVHDRLAEEHVLLMDSEERFRLLAENSSDLVLRTTADGTIEWVSGRVAELLGWDPDELVGTRSLDLAHPDDLERIRREAASVNAGDVVSGRVRVRTKDGGHRWMTRTLRPIHGDGGEIVARVSAWHDAQKDVEAEERLRASEEMFRVAMDSSAIGMAIVGPDGTLRRVNPAYCRMLHYSVEELQGTAVQRLTHPDDAAEAEANALRVVHGEVDTFSQRKRYLDRDGRTVWADVSVAALRTDEGELRHVFVQAVDVSAEVAAHEALERAASDFRTLAENASDIVVRLDTEGRITWISPSVRAVLGWDPDALVGTSALSMVEPDDHVALMEHRAGVLSGERSGPVVVRFRTSSGGSLELSGLATPLRSEDGTTVVGEVVGLRDVSAEMAVRRELAHRASHDALTGVVNRDDLLGRLRERLSLPPEEGSPVGLLFCDVDELKWLNDTYGHSVGDDVLVAVARRLEDSVRRHDVVARLSGDEFVVLLERVADLSALDAVIAKCREAVGSIVRPDGSPVSISIGGVVADLHEDADAVIHRADRAMMVDKELGRRTRVRRRGTRG